MAEAWNSPERDVTPEPVVLSRRKWLARAGLAAAALAGGTIAGYYLIPGSDERVLAAGRTGCPAPPIYPAVAHTDFTRAGQPVSAEADVARHCNFYEFSVTKQVWRYVGRFETEPWAVEVAGLVRRPRGYDLDDLHREFDFEERIYRHRCVERWAMVVPWTGFPLGELVRRADPLPEARYVRFVSFERPDQAGRQHSGEPWPYTEGLTLAEAANELAFLAVGMYGHPLLKQNGAPVRLVVPWKYGYKSAKSLVRIEFTRDRPATFWNTLAPDEYGFESNVNPDVPHPRWSQRVEWMLGTGAQHPTRVYNGYGEWVGGLYT